MRPGVALDAESVDAGVEHLLQLDAELGVARELIALGQICVGLERRREVGDPVLLADAMNGLLLHRGLAFDGGPVGVGLLDVVEQLHARTPQAHTVDLGLVEVSGVVDLAESRKKGAEHVGPPGL